MESYNYNCCYTRQPSWVPINTSYSCPYTPITTERKNNMKFDFGSASSNKVQYSPYGIAVSENGQDWYTYKPGTKQTIDVTGLTFGLSNLIMKIPVAPAAIKPGDLIDHKGKPVYVCELYDDKSLAVIDVVNSKYENIIPVSNMFGFDFVTKYKSLLNLSNTPTDDNPFGSNIGIFLALKNSDGDMAKALALAQMMKNGNIFNLETDEN